MRHKLVAIVASALALSLFGTPVAMAVAPSNDDFASATSVPEPLPFTDTVDTTDATTDVTDPPAEITSTCFETSHTVWYSFTPSATTLVQATTFGSDSAVFPIQLSVWTGTEGSLSEVTCDVDSFDDQFEFGVRFEAVGGTTYNIMVGSFPGTSGGSVTLNVATPTWLDALNIDPVGQVKPKTGQATLSGTVTCSGTPGRVLIDGELSQRSGRGTIHGFGIAQVEECSGETPWSMTVTGGLFVGGRALATFTAVSDTGFRGSIFVEEAPVRLRGGGA